MKMKTNFNKWIGCHEKTQSTYGILFLTLIAIAFVLADWSLFYFSFAEFIFIAIIPILFVIGQIRIDKKQIKILSVVIFLILFNSILQTMLGIEPFYTRLAVQASIKLVFYLLVVTFLFNYIKRNKFEDTFLAINNVLAILVIIVGLYIVFSIYHDHQYPYRFLWHFTRQDYKSYYFSGNSDFIRMRSVFSEPAHLGHYLMILLTANLSRGNMSGKKIILLSLLAFGVFLTFSYSMVFTLLVILGLYMIKNIDLKTVNKKAVYILILIVLGLSFFFRGYIYETFIQRTINIVTGVDTSAFNRLIESWGYIDSKNWWIGNGINHTPVITNNYAYMLSDFGLFGVIPFILFTVWTAKKSIIFGALFILLNFSRGGYLGPSLWFLILFILIYKPDDKKIDNKYARRSSHETIKWV